MGGLLFSFEVLAVVLIALWVWGQEHPSEGRRVTLFDMTGEAAQEPSGPAWRRAPSRKAMAKVGSRE